MADQDQNRNEAATPFKLEEARKRGSVARSMDVNSAAILSAGAIVLAVAGAGMARREMHLFGSILSGAGQRAFDAGSVGGYAVAALRDGLSILAPLFLALMVLAVLVNVLQTGPVFSFFPLKPDFDRINPVAGFKRLFSMRLLMEAVKTILKFGLMGWVLYAAITALIPTIAATMQGGPASVSAAMFSSAKGVLFKLVAVFVLIALLDVAFTRWDFAKRMRMSRREIRDEVKRREGDPRVKARLRELQREAVKRARSLGRVKDADVLITNPVHLAIALKYDRNAADAPQVIAKGAGFLAARMRTLARRHGVPVVENRPLARALFRSVKLEQVVPAEHFALVARILVWAYSMRGRHAAGAGA